MKRLETLRVKGRAYHYFRWPDGRRTPLIHGVAEDDPALIAAWSACNIECARTARAEDAPARGSVRQGLLAFTESQAFAQWAPVTRSHRASVYRRLIKSQGDRPLATIRRDHVEAALARKSPAGALADLKALRPAFAWLLRVGLIAENPIDGIKAAPLPRSDGFVPWTADDIKAFTARWPVGTADRLAFDLALFTGQRRADLVTLGRQMVRDGVLTLKQSKHGRLAYVPWTPDLAAAVAPFADRMVWLLTAYARPFTPAGLGNRFRDAANAAKVPKGLHGLRKAFCIYHAESGRTVHEIAAMSGHKRLEEIELYTRAADRQRMVRAIAAAAQSAKLPAAEC